MIKHLIIPFIIWTAFLPYITLYSFGTDIQPWNILFSFTLFIYLIFKRQKLNKYIIYLFLPALMSIFIVTMSHNFFSAIRSSIGYISIAVIPFVFLYILQNYYNLFEKILKLSVIIWFMVGSIQIIFNKHFAISILPRISSTGSRGVTSLAPEPTFYGLVLLFMLMIFLSLNIKDKKKYIYLILFQIIFFAQSSMVILFLMIYIFYFIIFNLKPKTFGYLLFGIIAITIVFMNVDLEKYSYIRAIDLLNTFIHNYSFVFYYDASLNDRLSAIYFSLKGVFDNYLLLNGFDTYSDYLQQQLPLQDFFWNVSKGNRIMSYYGSILYEIGFIGLIIPFVYFVIIFQAYKKNLKQLLINLFFINTILFSAIQLTFPLVGVYIATLLYRIKYENINYSQ